MKRRTFAWLAAAAAIGWTGPAAAQDIVIKAVSSFPEKTKESDRFEAMIETLNKRLKGVRVQYLGGAPKVMPPFEVVNNLKSGVIDLAGANSAFFTALVPEADGFKLAEYSIQELRKNGGWAYMNQILNEKANAHFLGNYLEFIEFHIYLNKPIEKADLRGLKIRVTPIYRPMVEALGGTAITSAPTEVYTLLERNTVDGYGWPSAGIFEYSWEKVTKYRVDPPFYNAALHALVNLNTWRKLSEEQRKTMQAVMDEVEATNITRKEVNAAELKRQEAFGIKAIKLPPDEAKKWLDTARNAAWAAVERTSPQHAAKMKELFIRK